MDAALSVVVISVFKMVLSVVSQNNNNYKTELKSIINVIKHVTVLGIYAEYRPLNTVEN